MSEGDELIKGLVREIVSCFSSRKRVLRFPFNFFCGEDIKDEVSASTPLSAPGIPKTMLLLTTQLAGFSEVQRAVQRAIAIIGLL